MERNQELFDYMSNEHSVILLGSEMQEIISICTKSKESDLLDRFAGLAMQGILSAEIEMRAHGGSHTDTHSPPNYLAKESYLIAQAMLNARREVSND